VSNRAERRAEGRSSRNRGAVELKQPAAPPQQPQVISFAYAIDPERGMPMEFHRSISRTLQALVGRYGIRELPTERTFDEAADYSRLVDAFLGTNDDFLLLADPDVVFGPEDVALLLAAGQPIAGALSFAAATGQEPRCTALVEVGDGAYAPPDLPALPEIPVLEEDANDEDKGTAVAGYIGALEQVVPIKVSTPGRGLVLITHEAVAAVRSTYAQPFEREGDLDPLHVFCGRAADAGFDPYLVPRAAIGRVVRMIV
jgi:hypothetical protein